MTLLHAPLARRGLLRALGAAALVPLAARAFAATPAPANTPAVSPLPGDSAWQLPVDLVDQDGHPFRLASLRGSPVLASMFYTSCDMVCPLIFETLSMTLRAAGPGVAARMCVLMVSFDPDRDTVPVLHQAFVDHHAGPRWTLARGDAEAVRQVAAVLGVQYRRLAGGAFNHSTTIDLMDADGRIVEHSARLGQADDVLVRGMKRLAG